MVGNWNPDRKGFWKISSDEFAQLKLTEFWTNLKVSCVAGLVLQSLWNLVVKGRPIQHIILEDCMDMSVGLGFVLVLTMGASYFTQYHSDHPDPDKKRT